jgi:protein gp37
MPARGLSLTKIQYAQKAWHLVTGCTRVSAGCDHCYAQRLLARKLPGLGHNAEPGRVVFHEDRLSQPLHTRKPAVVFVAPLGDLFHEDVEQWMFNAIIHGMLDAPQHVYLLLTKRPYAMARMMDYFAEEHAALSHLREPLSKNLWLGVSVEDQATADERLPILASIDWPNKWISAEPLLGPVDSCSLLTPRAPKPEVGEAYPGARPSAMYRHGDSAFGWVVCGCESGPGARPFDEDWARELRDECEASRTPFYYKQAPRGWCRRCQHYTIGTTGDDCPGCDGRLVRRGVWEHPLLDGRTWTETPWGGTPDA